MRFSLAFVSIAVALSGVLASPLGEDQIQERGNNLIIKFDLSIGNKYNALIPPWERGAHPGWYYGSNPQENDQYPCLRPDSCKYLKSCPGWNQCPPPEPPQTPPYGYVETFHNLTGATQASDYLTYGLVDTIAACEAMCNSVAGCKFVNTYHDVNGKNGSPDLTCALFSECHTSADAINKGGQTQSDGTVDYIIDSDGWCKL